MFAKDLGMNGIELASDAVEQLGPFSFELTIHQALSFGPVGNVREAVIMLQVLQIGGLHLSRQPFPSVEADLNGEREPSLDAGIEKAEDRIDLVVVEEEAFARGGNLKYLLTHAGATNIWQQPLSGREAKQLTKFTSGLIFGFSWSSDRTHLLLTRCTVSRDVVLLSNLR